MVLSRETQTDLDAIIDGLRDPRLTARWRYYSGDQPRIWLTPKIKELFASLADRLIENYCSTAISARTQRLEVVEWAGDGAELAQAVWTDRRWDSRQNDFYRWSLVHGRAYLLAHPDPQRNGTDYIYTPLSAAWTYGVPTDDPSVLDLAGKVWQEPTEGRWRAILWDRDGMSRRFTGPQLDEDRSSSQETKWPAASEFDVDAEDSDPVDTGLGYCPVIPCTPYGTDAPPLLDQITPIQDRINKISANKFVASEFAAFKQRVFFTRQDVTQGDVQQAPDWAIILDPGDPSTPARVQELTATDLANYDAAKQAEVNALFTIASLPRHLMVNPGTSPSGEAIKADEGPLVEALYDLQREFTTVQRRGMENLGILDAEPQWRSVEVRNDLTVAQIVKTFIDAGIPWQTVVEKYAAWGESDIAAAERQIALLAAQRGQQTTTSFLDSLGAVRP